MMKTAEYQAFSARELISVRSALSKQGFECIRESTTISRVFYWYRRGQGPDRHEVMVSARHVHLL